MNRTFLITGVIFLTLSTSIAKIYAQAQESNYLNEVKTELVKEWPKNRTINLVFHGHSVPSGYFKTPVVNTLGAYPHLVLKALKTQYPYAVINIIVTAIGGESSVNGVKRFDSDVLTHKPDVLFIDYALNDRGAGLTKPKVAMTTMIEKALAKGIKIILLTPTPHQKFNYLDPQNGYEPFTNQIIELAKKYNIGLVDSYALFKEKLAAGHNVTEYMSQVNHPNEAGHQIVADEITKWFITK